MTQVYLAFGSNLGDRVENIRRALDALAPDVRVLRVSPLYETAPAYVTDQPRFVNGVLRADTDLSPRDLLRHLKTIELKVGRTPAARFGPRLIDLDILFYGGDIVATRDIEIPHPRLAERLFVLRPLQDIAPDLVHPALGTTIATLHAALPDDPAMRRMDEIL